MNSKQWKHFQITVVVIIAAICATILWMGSGGPRWAPNYNAHGKDNAVLYPEQSEDRIPGDNRFMGIPAAPDCTHLYNKPGKHREWAECMGVGYDSTSVDRRLYTDRGAPVPDCAKIPTDWRIHEWRAYCVAAGRDKKRRAYR